MELIVLDPASDTWAELLGTMPHDFYHLPEYASFARDHQDGGTPLAFGARHGDAVLLLPLLVRPVPMHGVTADWRDATSPRGYPGPILTPEAAARGDAFLTPALDLVRAGLRDHSVAAAYVRLHPLLGVSPEPLARLGTVVNHGESISIDITLSEEELWRQTRDDHRQGIRKAERRGLVASVDDDWTYLRRFVDIYGASMRRVGAAPFWQLSPAYFDGLRRALGDRLHLAVVLDGETVAAAGLLTEVDGVVEYHLAGTADEYVRASPSKLLIHFARSWAKARGNRVLHLGGSLRPEDALLQFKLGFSPRRHDVMSWRLVADTGAYEELTTAWQTQAGQPADPADGYFPAYRKPASPAD